MIADKKFKYIGLSECTPDELRAAHAVHPITAVQMEFSLAERGIVTSGMLDLTQELGVAVVAYSPLCRGLLTGAVKAVSDLAEGDRRAIFPRFAAGEVIASNAAKSHHLTEMGMRLAANRIGGALAASLHTTPSQLALAWLLRQGANVFPIPGSKTAARVKENVHSIAVAAHLTDAEVAEIGNLDLSMAGGDRYHSGGMQWAFETRMQK